MKHKFGILLSALILSGCATVASQPSHVEFALVDSRFLTISRVNAQDRGASTLIAGRVARRSMHSGIIGGHLHIEAWGGGELLATKDTLWHLLPRRRAASTSFVAKIPVPLEQIEEIRVSHVLRRDSNLSYIGD
jgi:hypothetical protein